MSGICGIVNFGGAPVDASILRSMAEAAACRGPDGIHYWIEDNVGLAHLAMHSTPESPKQKQPLLNERGDLVVTADARLYNRQEVLKALGSQGHPGLPEPSDAALLAAAYDRWGADCGEHLVGDFAVAFWDKRTQGLLLLRDRLGALPLYYHVSGDLLIFASEVQQILRFPGIKRELDPTMVAAHLVATPASRTATFFQDVVQLAPAHALLARDGRISLREYWRLDPAKSIRYRHDDDYAEHFRELFERAVVSRLRAQGPVGIMLSGGLDSSAVACLAARHYTERTADGTSLRTFTWAFDGSEAILGADEQSYAEAVASYWQLPLTRVPAHLHWPLSDVEEFLPHPDEPFQGHYQALIRATLLAAREQGVRVMLTGHPGDNAVGGFAYSYADSFLRLRWLKLVKDIRLHCRLWEASPRRVMRNLCLKPIARAWRERRKGTGPSYYMDAAPNWIAPRFWQDARLAEVVSEVRRPAGLRFRSLAQRQRYYMLVDPHIAHVSVWADRLAASNGLEFRHPWLDAGLFEFLLAVPQDQVIRAGVFKFVLRNALRDVMPVQVRERVGKTTPGALLRWSYREKGMPVVRQLLGNSLAGRYGYIDAGEAITHYERFLAGEVKQVHPLWYTLIFELWLRTWMPNNVQ